MGISVLCGLIVGLLLAFIFIVAAPKLPSLDALTDYRPKIPLRVYTADNVLIGEFGEEHRDFVPIGKMPLIIKQAVLAAEDARFYEHSGVDMKSVARALLADMRGSMAQGASTITMQVARNFFLTREKTYSRKLTEVMLAYKIESALSKDQILELYMNQIFLGQRAYGFANAAQVYLGKSIDQATLADAAMLAGLPQAPTTHNPVVNPKRAISRQQHILRRMQQLGYISEAQFAAAQNEAFKVRGRGQEYATHAEYAAEIVRQTMYASYKEEAYTHGYSVYTTLNKADQDAAYEALRRNVMVYEQRHGYRGPEAVIDLPADEAERQQAIETALLKRPVSDRLLLAVVVSASPKLVRAALFSGDVIDIGGEGLRFAAAALAGNASAQLKLRPGAIIRISQDARKSWAITQLPEVAAGFVALDGQTGAYRALVGGFDFNLNKFNHVSQAWRQPGSGMKPFIYSAALEMGFSPATLINDAPLVLGPEETGGQAWEPRNDDRFEGPLTMRTALARSKNVVSVRILRKITPKYAHDYLARFGFDAAKQPVNYTLTLGTGAVTPLQMAAAYSVFANGGFQVAPYLIQKVVDGRGNVVSEAAPVVIADESRRVIDPRNAFIMDTMLRDVVRRGTGASAGQKLGRRDLAGKTGTTTDALDGWFAGYSGDVVAVGWMGYDEPKSLGGREFGATLSLPIWIDYMRVARAGKPEAEPAAPAGVSLIDGDWMYDEYVGEAGVRELDMQDGAPTDGANGEPAPATVPVPAPVNPN